MDDPTKPKQESDDDFIVKYVPPISLPTGAPSQVVLYSDHLAVPVDSEDDTVNYKPQTGEYQPTGNPPTGGFKPQTGEYQPTGNPPVYQTINNRTPSGYTPYPPAYQNSTKEPWLAPWLGNGLILAGGLLMIVGAIIIMLFACNWISTLNSNSNEETRQSISESDGTSNEDARQRNSSVPPTIVPSPSPAPQVEVPAVVPQNNVPTPLPAPVMVIPTFTAAPAQGMEVLQCESMPYQTAPNGGQVFYSNIWKSDQAVFDDCYTVVFDPDQSGDSRIPAMGWYYQPYLPSGPERQYHEGAIIMRPGEYTLIGPECSFWVAPDMQNTGRNGTLISNRQNVRNLVINRTLGTRNEAYVFFSCQESEAGGWSAAITKLFPAP